MAPPKLKVKGITPISVSEHTEEAMKVYGRYVLQERAVADVRDGLKPVQRRILFSAYSLKLQPNKPFVKSARVVGDTMGNYHPHGDSAIYGTLVTMVHAANPLMEGHGNWGTVTDPEVAAMRYTETKMRDLGASLFDDIAVAKMIPNYDGKTKEPEVLPARLPLLVINGSEGIAVGLSANTPPHNINEVIAACKELLDDSESETFLKHIRGPDYGTGVCISARSEIERVYTSGRGSLRYRCKYHYETNEDSNQLVITEFVPRFKYGPLSDKGSFLAKCAELEDDGVITFVSNQTSHKSGLRIVVGFKSPKLLQDRFLKLLRQSVGYQLNAVFPDGSVSLSGMRGLLLQFLDFRRDIETKSLNKDLKDTEDALAKENAKLSALLNIKALMKVLEDKSVEDSDLVGRVAKALAVTTAQAEFILSCQIRTLARANRDKLEENIKAHEEEIGRIKAKLKDIDGVVRDRLDEMLKKFGRDRRMVISKKEPKIVESVGSMFVGMTKGGDFNKFATFPKQNKQKFDFMLTTDDTVTAVGSSGMARIVEVLTQKRTGLGLGKDKIVGVAASTKQRLLVKDVSGKCMCLAPRDVKLRGGELDYKFINSDKRVNFATGFDLEDQVVAYNANFFSVCLGKDIKTKRKGSAGWRILKGRSDYNVIVIPSAATVMLKDGKTIRDLEEIQNHKPEDLWVVAKSNIVTIGERKLVLSALEIASRLSRGEYFDNVFPL